jgi:hypothetical protein
MFPAVLAALVAVSLVAAPSEAGKRKPKPKMRKATAAYDSPAIGGGDATGVCSGANGCVSFGVGPKETTIDLVVEDAAGLPVSATVGQDSDPSNATTEVVGRFCGETEEPLVIQPGITVTVWLWLLPGLNPACPGAATSGTVTATFR